MNLREDILRYARDKYKTEPEYLWRRFPRYAVLRHDDNRKWYGLIMDVPRKNLAPFLNCLGKSLLSWSFKAPFRPIVLPILATSKSSSGICCFDRDFVLSRIFGFVA